MADDVEHGMCAAGAGVKLHYVTAGEGARTIVLLHGYPQTWWAWRHVIGPLTRAGFRVVAPDYRGAGHSSKPASGYDKRSMAGDIRVLLREHLGITGPVTMVGHDIGMMVAFAYAQAFRDEVSLLALLDTPLPGTAVFDRLRADPRIWQFSFHAVPDIPEMLVFGRERQYLKAFFDARIFNAGAVPETDLDIYASAYSAAGAMRAAFALYRTFDQDIADTRASLARDGKLAMPVLAMGGAASTTGPLMEEMIREVAGDVTSIMVPGAAHWLAEESPAAVVAHLLRHVQG